MKDSMRMHFFYTLFHMKFNTFNASKYIDTVGVVV